MTVTALDATEAEFVARSITLYRVLSRAYFHLPIVVAFLVLEGYTAGLTACFLAFYGVVVAFGDIIVAPARRRLSLAGSLVVGEVVKTVALLVLVVPVSIASVLLSQFLSAAGFAMTAGTDAALASTVREGEQYRAQESATQMGMFLISFAAGVVGAVAFAAWNRAPFVMSAGATLAAAAVLLRARLPLLHHASSVAEKSSPSAADNGDAGARVPGDARFWSSYYSVNRAVLLSTYTYLLPLLLFFELDVHVEMFGAVLGLYTLFGLIAARVSLKLGARPESKAAFLMTGVAAGIALVMLIPGAFWPTTLSIASLGLAGGLVRPATMMNLGPAMTGMNVVSRQRMMRGLERTQALIQAAILLSAGLWLEATEGLKGTFGALGCVVLLFHLIGYRRSRRRTVGAGSP